MLQNWQFIDPKLATKYQSIHNELIDLQAQRQKILSNKKLNHATKQKLLQYNDECIQNMNAVLQKEKQFMVNYFDRQVNVLTKEQIQEVKEESSLDIDARMGLNGNQNERRNKRKILTHVKNRGSWGNDDSLDKNETMSTFFNRTRVVNESRDDFRGNRNDLGSQTTDRIAIHQSKQNTDRNKTVTNFITPYSKRKANSHKPTLKRLKRRVKFYRNKAEFYQLTNTIAQMSTQQAIAQAQQHKNEVEILKQQISSLLKQRQRKQRDHKQELQLMKMQYNSKLLKIAEDYNQLGKVKQINKHLMMKRKQLLREIH